MLISIIIPAYNAEKYLRRAVESVINTGYPDMEIIVIDDGSHDKTFSIVKELESKYKKYVKALQHDGQKNLGVSASRNLGILHSTGEAVCFLDADDFVHPNRFLTSIEILKSQHDVDGVYELTRMEFEKEHDRFVWWDNKKDFFGFQEPIAPEDLLTRLLAGKEAWHVSAILVRCHLLKKTGLFNKKMKIAEDCNLWLRMACAGKIVAGDIRQPVSTYFRHSDSTYQPLLKYNVDMIYAMIDFYKWIQRRKIDNSLQIKIQKAISQYIIESLVTARENKLHCLAWEIAIKAFLWVPSFCLNDRFFANLAWMFRGK